MLYSDKMNRVLSGATSDTQRALNGLAGRLRMSPDEMARDLRQEKLAAFSQTEVYKRVFALADQSGRAAPRQIIPQIVLISPKFTHQLTGMVCPAGGWALQKCMGAVASWPDLSSVQAKTAQEGPFFMWRAASGETRTRAASRAVLPRPASLGSAFTV
jgi:hypothetical protein